MSKLNLVLIGTIASVNVGKNSYEFFAPTEDCELKLNPDLKAFLKTINEEQKSIIFGQLKASYEMAEDEKFTTSQWAEGIRVMTKALEKGSISQEEWDEKLYFFSWGLMTSEIELNESYKTLVEDKLDTLYDDYDVAINEFREYSEMVKAEKEAEAAKAKAAAETAKTKKSAPGAPGRKPAPQVTEEEEAPNTETGVVSSNQNLETAHNAAAAAEANIYDAIENLAAGMQKLAQAAKAANVAKEATVENAE